MRFGARAAAAAPSVGTGDPAGCGAPRLNGGGDALLARVNTPANQD